jgi:hypothetical protein
MAVKYIKWTCYIGNVIPTFSIARPSKIYPNLDFWFENIPSGNPGPQISTMADNLKNRILPYLSEASFNLAPRG